MEADHPVFRLQRGTAPLLVSIPHAGTYVPAWLKSRLTSAALELPDTDWHVDRLYDFLGELGIGCIAATHSRYVLDLNRPADDTSLYPGQNTTGLCPANTFAQSPLYKPGEEPSSEEIAARTDAFWRPFHEALAGELARLQALHGRVILWDAHSIRSRVPRFFDGELPHLNFGSADGASCDSALMAQLGSAAAQSSYSWVVNGRFRGGHITRQYGRPQSGVHAVQLELAQRAYLQEHDVSAEDAARWCAAQTELKKLLSVALDWLGWATPAP